MKTSLNSRSSPEKPSGETSCLRLRISCSGMWLVGRFYYPLDWRHERDSKELFPHLGRLGALRRKVRPGLRGSCMETCLFSALLMTCLWGKYNTVAARQMGISITLEGKCTFPLHVIEAYRQTGIEAAYSSS